MAGARPDSDAARPDALYGTGGAAGKVFRGPGAPGAASILLRVARPPSGEGATLTMHRFLPALVLVLAAAFALAPAARAEDDVAGVAREVARHYAEQYPLDKLAAPEAAAVLSALLALAPETFAQIVAAGPGRSATLAPAFARCSQTLAAVADAAAGGRPDTAVLVQLAVREGFDWPRVAAALQEPAAVERVFVLAQDSSLALVLASNADPGASAQRLMQARFAAADALRRQAGAPDTDDTPAHRAAARRLAAAYEDRVRENLRLAQLVCAP